MLSTHNILIFPPYIAKKACILQQHGDIINFVRVFKGGEPDLANIKSALKRVKVSREQNLRNRMISSAVKTAIKKFDKALESKDEAAIEEAYTAAVSKVDKAVTKGVIHKNAANRKKAQLAKKHDAK